MNSFEDFGRRLKQTAVMRDISRPSELAKKTSLNRVTVAAYWRGARLASLEACVVLAEYLKVDPYWLRYGEKSPSLFSKIVDVPTPKNNSEESPQFVFEVPKKESPGLSDMDVFELRAHVARINQILECR